MPGPVSVSIGPGLFGKAPETGDFVSRGVPAPFRRMLDRWVSVHLAVRHGRWPEGGVRGLLEFDETLVLFVALDSKDAVGRRFPLLALTDGAQLSLETADAWCDGAEAEIKAVVAGEARFDAAFARLIDIEPRQRDGPNGSAALWLAGGTPMPSDQETLDAMFAAGAP